MPASTNGLLIGLVLGAGMLAGCSTTRLEPAISPLSELGADATEISESSEYAVVLPDEVAVLPSILCRADADERCRRPARLAAACLPERKPGA